MGYVKIPSLQTRLPISKDLSYLPLFHRGQGAERSGICARLTPARAEAAANCLSEVKGCTLDPYSVIAMFMVTVPLAEDVTGGTPGDCVTCWAETGPLTGLMGAEAWGTGAGVAVAADPMTLHQEHEMNQE